MYKLHVTGVNIRNWTPLTGHSTCNPVHVAVQNSPRNIYCSLRSTRSLGDTLVTSVTSVYIGWTAPRSGGTDHLVMRIIIYTYMYVHVPDMMGSKWLQSNISDGLSCQQSARNRQYRHLNARCMQGLFIRLACLPTREIPHAYPPPRTPCLASFAISLDSLAAACSISRIFAPLRPSSKPGRPGGVGMVRSDMDMLQSTQINTCTVMG